MSRRTPTSSRATASAGRQSIGKPVGGWVGHDQVDRRMLSPYRVRWSPSTPSGMPSDDEHLVMLGTSGGQGSSAGPTRGDAPVRQRRVTTRPPAPGVYFVAVYCMLTVIVSSHFEAA
jgi:hypothetical protein